MTLWLDMARLLAAGNVVLLVALGAVWVDNFRQHGAQHTLALLVVGGFLFLENVLWLYLYVVHPAFIGWFNATTPDVQIGVMGLCGLEFIALAVLARITWL